MDRRLRWAVRALVVIVAAVLGMVAAREAGGRPVLGGCDATPPSTTTVIGGVTASGTCDAGDPAKARLLALIGGVGGALVAIPASWPLTRRDGEPFWAPDPR